MTISWKEIQGCKVIVLVVGRQTEEGSLRNKREKEQATLRVSTRDGSP